MAMMVFREATAMMEFVLFLSRSHANHVQLDHPADLYVI
jgi:hypothetical protein